MSDSPITVIADVYRNMARKVVQFAYNLADGDNHLAYALLNEATERLRSINHVNFSLNYDELRRRAAEEVKAADTPKQDE